MFTAIWKRIKAFGTFLPVSNVLGFFRKIKVVFCAIIAISILATTLSACNPTPATNDEPGHIPSTAISTPSEEDNVTTLSTTTYTVDESAAATTIISSTTTTATQQTASTTTPKSTIHRTTETVSTTTTTSAKHVHKYDKTVVSPTCIEPGYTMHICACRYSYKDNYIAALGHKWSDWKTVTKPTEEKTGKATCHCTACGSEDFREIPKLFAGKLSVCTFENVMYLDARNEKKYAAVARMYAIAGDDAVAEKEIKKAFREKYGFDATAKISQKVIGVFTVEGYEYAQQVWEYKIYDTTYPFKDNEDYVVYHQICTDGSPWVGFSIPATMDTLPEVMRTSRYAELNQQMREEFEQVLGRKISDLVKENPEKYAIGYVSNAGPMRTADGKLVNTLYICCRVFADR